MSDLTKTDDFKALIEAARDQGRAQAFLALSIELEKLGHPYAGEGYNQALRDVVFAMMKVRAAPPVTPEKQ